MGSPSSNGAHQGSPLPEASFSECDDNNGGTEINSFYVEVHSSKDFGRYLVAKEDIDEKTLILSETPVLFGPTDDKDLETDTVFLFCLSCCRQLTKNLGSCCCNSRDDFSLGNQAKENKEDAEVCNGNEDDDGCRCSKSSSSEDCEHVYHCSKCGWPVCDKHCETAPVHSHNECKFFTFLYYNQPTYPPPHKWLMYKSVILLRLLLLIHKNPRQVFEDFIEKLEHHTEIRNTKPNCVKADILVIENLKYFIEGLKSLRKSKSKKKFNLPFLDNEAMLKRLIGTVNVNGFCANNDSSRRIARCLFVNASLFAHSCAPNCAWSIEMSLSDAPKRSSKRRQKNGCVRESSHFENRIMPQIQVYSSVFIKKGDLVTIPYSTRNLFYGTLKRQLCMESTGHFICKCRRCNSCNEMGTFMSSLRCFRCEKGFLITSDPTDEDAPWICVSSDGEGPFPTDENKFKTDCDNDNENNQDACDYKCTIGKIVYFTTKIQDQIDRIRSLDLEWDEEHDKLHNLYEKYFGQDLHENHYLLHEISTRIVELLEERLAVKERSPSSVDVRITAEKRLKLLHRLLFHIKYLIKIANLILPGFNSHQGQLHCYLEEAESLLTTENTF